MKTLCFRLPETTLLSLLLLSTACSDPAPTDKSNEGGSGGTMSSGTSGKSGAGGSSGMSGMSGMSGAGGSSGTAGQAPACNQIVLDAPDNILTTDPGAPPAAEGGTVVDGTYFLTHTTWYGQSGSTTFPLGRMKLELAGTEWQAAEDIDSLADDDSLEPTAYSTAIARVSGTAFTLTETCPSTTLPSNMEFTAKGSTLTLYVIDSGEHFGQVFERQ